MVSDDNPDGSLALWHGGDRYALPRCSETNLSHMIKRDRSFYVVVLLPWPNIAEDEFRWRVSLMMLCHLLTGEHLCDRPRSTRCCDIDAVVDD